MEYVHRIECIASSSNDYSYMFYQITMELFQISRFSFLLKNDPLCLIQILSLELKSTTVYNFEILCKIISVKLNSQIILYYSILYFIHTIYEYHNLSHYTHRSSLPTISRNSISKVWIPTALSISH